MIVNKRTLWVYNFFNKNIFIISIFFNILLICSLYYNFLSAIFPIILLLSILPGFIFIFKNNKLSRKELLMILLPIIITRYILPIRFGLPSGYEDIHDHLIWTEISIENGKILFSELDRASNNFVGLYIFYNIIKYFTGLSIPTLAITVHPLLNIISFVIFYNFSRLFLKEKTALMALIIFNWEPVVFDFGEFRTQSFSLIFLIMLIYLIFKNRNNYSMKNILILIAMLGIVVSSFVTIFITLIFISIIFINNILISKIINTKEKELFLLDKNYLIIFSMSFIIYISYIGNSFYNLAPTIFVLLNDMFSFKYSPPNVLSSIFIDYGIGAYYIQWTIKIVIFIFTTLLFFYQIKNKKSIPLTLITLTLGFIVSLALFGAFELSVNRIYYFFIIFSSITTVQGINIFINNLSNKYTKIFNIFIFLLLITYATFSIIRLPNYIIGNTYPFRTTATIDQMKYYEVTKKDITIGSYLKNYAGNMHVYFYSVLNIYSYYYPYTDIISVTNLKDYVNNNLIIFLHNTYDNESYYERKLMPTLDNFYHLNVIFQNGDMFLFNTFNK